MKRAPALQHLLDEMSEAAFGVSNTDAGIASICVFCHKKVDTDEFTDRASKREWEISRICEACQNETFTQV